MNKENIVIYGASGGGEKILLTLQNMGIEVDYFVDSNSEKWGLKFLGKDIKSPEEITKDKKIIIASELNQEQIEIRLAELNLTENIIMKEEIMLPFMCNLSIGTNSKEINNNGKSKIFIELLEGVPTQPDGLADWCKIAAQLLKERNKNVKIITSKKLGVPSENIELYEFIETDYSTYWQDVEKLYYFLEKNLPCTVILNKQMQLFYAAALLKKVYKNKIRLISVVHSDACCLYKRSQLINSYIDSFIAGSGVIKEKLFEYKIQKEKVVYQAMPIAFSNLKNHEYSTSDEPITIGYAGRLTVQVKRCDLLIQLIECLEKRKCNYKFYIAGAGEYEKIISDYVLQQQLTEKVIMCGNLKKNEIQEFWVNKDICVLTSEKEGCCLSMAEAMVAGAVPVTTAFSSAIEYTTEAEAGYVVDFGNVNSIADIIGNLELNRQSLQEQGHKVQRYAITKFSYSEYGCFLEEILK